MIMMTMKMMMMVLGLATARQPENLLNIRQIGITRDNTNRLDPEVVFQLKYLGNFWRYFDLLLINCEIKFDLKWSKIV